ncbi:DUF5819 family protein [Streptomyces oceani]|uniref:Uncharacterized protein n=1 Tax=Streptomyces oceani TaxID=1075402 RepID=A0A1E7JWW3_9ACTN|nr:DUF5819 family protein [Streptomyces oceani]OEU96122.1 hypothetical protein AN216_22540 [Streptomyces oceani]
MQPLDEEGRGGGVGSLSLPGRITVAIATAGVALAVIVHVTMVFLHVAPENTMSKEHRSTVSDYVLPEFEQNWKLFAPNPLQENIYVHARAQVLKDDGGTENTGWVNLSAMDGERIRGNLLPSHSAQNELRRAWDFYTGSHDEDHQPTGMRGELSKQYVKRIVMERFGPELNGGTVERIQLRSASTRVAPPDWSEEKVDTDTEYWVLPWWDVSEADLRGAR